LRSPRRRAPPTREPQDLGFGAVVANQSRQRLLNRDGSFNVVRRGRPWQTSLSVYQALLELSWPRFLGWIGGLYTLLNALFAGGYLALGPGTLAGGEEVSWTLVHPIDTESPLAGMSAADLARAEIELFILLTAIDYTFSQTVHTRSSYASHELVWGGRFSSLFVDGPPAGPPTIDLARLSAFEKVEGPARLIVDPPDGALSATTVES
jgi:hypothetical protein